MKKFLLSFLAVAVVIGTAVVGNRKDKATDQTQWLSSLPEFEPPAEIDTMAYCPLCESVPANGPLLVNTNVGAVVEIQIFDTELRDRLTILEKRNYGFIRVCGAGGAYVHAFPDDCYADVSIQRQYLFKYAKEMAEHFFCTECIAKIEEVNPTSNFILVDGYNKNNLQFYCLQDIEKADLRIRHYSFVLDEISENRFAFKVLSNYFEGGRAMDYLNP